MTNKMEPKAGIYQSKLNDTKCLNKFGYIYYTKSALRKYGLCVCEENFSIQP